MNVTIVCDILGKENNGTAIAAMNLIRAMKARGHHVITVCPDEDKAGDPDTVVLKKRHFGPFDRYIEKNGVSAARPDPEKLKSAVEGADVVHLLLPFSVSRKMIPIAKSLGIPLTAGFHCQAENITSHIFLKDARRLNRLIYRFFWKNVYRHCDAIHFPSSFIRRTFEDAVGRETPGWVISNGVNDRFRRRETPRPAEWADRFVILFTGRYSKEKCHSVLIEGVRRSRYRDRIQLIFAGAGPLEKKLKRQSACLPNRPVFRFFERDEMLDVLNYADLYVHPAEIEIEAISCLEAISCGLVPVIADSDRSATRGFALDERNLFRSGDPDSLAARIDYWIEHPDEREAVRQAYIGYAERFRQEACMDRMEEMLLKAAGKGKRDVS